MTSSVNDFCCANVYFQVTRDENCWQDSGFWFLKDNSCGSKSGYLTTRTIKWSDQNSVKQRSEVSLGVMWHKHQLNQLNQSFFFLLLLLLLHCFLTWTRLVSRSHPQILRQWAVLRSKVNTRWQHTDVHGPDTDPVYFGSSCWSQSE